MSRISVRVDDQLKARMERHPEINWSEVTRQAINEKAAAIERLERMDELMEGSEATPEAVDEIADTVNEGLARRYEERDQTTE
jgi:Arc/MetJ-type ribon-helix-helix transcriptional regulator